MCVNGKDPFITYLKSIGYSPIRLPRTDIRPLQVLAGKGRELDWLGDLPTLFGPTAPAQLPPTRQDEPAADVNGQRSGELSLGLGLNLLGNLIGAMGGSNLGLKAAYKGTDQLAFEFAGVLRDSVSVIALDRYLGQSDVDPAAPTVAKMLEADTIYITTATIKSSTYRVESLSKSGGSVEVEVPVIQAAVGGSVTVGGASQRASTISYTGATPLVFGFQAVQLFYDRGKYTALKPVATGVVVARALSAAPNDGAERLVVEGAFANLN